METDILIEDTSRIQDQAETIAQSVLQKCKIESEQNKLEIPLLNFKSRTAYYTGLPESFVAKLSQDQNQDDDPHTYDVFERMLVLKSLLKTYSKHNPNSKDEVQQVYGMIKDSINVKSLAHFYHKLTEMGFDYRKTMTGQILTEDMKLTFERSNYLKKIKKCKNDKINIYYIDERLLDSSLKFPKPDFDKISDTEDATHLYNGYYFYHVFSSTKLENYLFTNKKCKDTYNKWVFSILIKLLKPGSLIVIDDHPLHGKLVDDMITRYHSKSKMINWLKNNNIPCSITMSKAELYELISKCNQSRKDYDFDKLLKSYGFDVLRLPFGCKNLSPSSLLWKEFATKNMLDSSKSSSPLELENKIIPAISSLHWSSWKKLEDRICYWEDQFMDLDSEIENILDNICVFDINNMKT